MKKIFFTLLIFSTPVFLLAQPNGEKTGNKSKTTAQTKDELRKKKLKKMKKKELVRQVMYWEDAKTGYLNTIDTLKAQIDTLEVAYKNHRTSLKAQNINTKSDYHNCQEELQKKEAAIETLRKKLRIANSAPAPVSSSSPSKKQYMRYDEDIQRAKRSAINQINRLSTSSGKRVAVKVRMQNAQIDAYVVDMKANKDKVKLFWKNENRETYRTLGRLKTDMERNEYELKFAMNGGMYTPNSAPQGLFVENGKQKQNIDLKIAERGNFDMPFSDTKPFNGVFLIDNMGTAKVIGSRSYDRYKSTTKYATQSGPLLVLDGEINNKFNIWSSSRKNRNGVGVMPDGTLVFIITDDPINLYDFARLFRDVFNCQNALYLDGVVSKMFCPELNRNNSNLVRSSFGPLIGIVE